MADPAAAWAAPPGGDYSEELAWLTDVLQAPTGGTQHRRLRESPRTTVGFSALASGAIRRWLEAQLRAYSAARWWVPVAIDARDLNTSVSAGATSLPVTVAGARFVVGGRVLVVGEDPRSHEVATITAVGASSLTVSPGLASAWPAAGTRLIPLRAGRLAEPPQVQRFTADDTGLIALRFRLDDPLDTAPAAPGATYRGYPVFEVAAPVWTADPAWVPERQTETVDYDVAPPVVLDAAGVALGKTTMHYAPDTAAAVVNFRAALFALAGRWSPAWVPSWAADLRLVADVAAAQAFVDVEGPLLSAAPLASNRRDIRIELIGGTVHYRRITGATVQSATVDRLALDSALPAAFAAAAVRLVSFITLSVQDADTNSLRYFDATLMQCELTWRELDHEL